MWLFCWKQLLYTDIETFATLCGFIFGRFACRCGGYDGDGDGGDGDRGDGHKTKTNANAKAKSETGKTGTAGNMGKTGTTVCCLPPQSCLDVNRTLRALNS